MSKIGENALFAIEYELDETSEAPHGGLRVWAAGSSFGTLEDRVPLLGACESLSLLLSSDRYCAIPLLLSDSISPRRKLDVISADEINHDRFMFNVDESTDDFTIFAFLDCETLHLLWERLPTTFFKYRDAREPKYARIPIDVVKQVLDEFRGVIRDFQGTNPCV